MSPSDTIFENPGCYPGLLLSPLLYAANRRGLTIPQPRFPHSHFSPFPPQLPEYRPPPLLRLLQSLPPGTSGASVHRSPQHPTVLTQDSEPVFSKANRVSRPCLKPFNDFLMSSGKGNLLHRKGKILHSLALVSYLCSLSLERHATTCN